MATDLLIESRPEATVDRLPDLYEIVHGQVVETPPMSWYAEEVANVLNLAIAFYLRTNPIGRSRSEMLFRIPQVEDPTRSRRPDVSFITYERWPRDRTISLKGTSTGVVPDLCVEVISPHDTVRDVQNKIRDYLRAGVREVWLIFPDTQELHAYDGSNVVRVSRAGGDIDGCGILPGFRFPVADLFPPLPPGEPEPLPDDQ